jgi:nucleoid-associated protein YgaU
MELAKLNIRPLPPSGLAAFDVLFNPNTYSIVKPVTWTQQADAGGAAAAGGSAGSGGPTTGTNRDLDAPPLVFGGGGARTLTLQLFFDVTEGGADGQTTDVRTETNKIVALTRIERKQGKPPVCEVTWGKAAPQNMDFPFVGVVTSLTQNFVLFRANGEPVRANLTVVFTEFIDPVKNRQETDPDLTTYLVKRGDTLSTIAAKLYRDPTQWRAIAWANAIDDPRHLQIGVRLTIPKLT